jgi:hypothetical protein
MVHIQSSFMDSARAQCPECDGPHVLDLNDLLYSRRVDFFRCTDCFCWWFVPKDEDHPPTRIVLGNPDAIAVRAKVG